MTTAREIDPEELEAAIRFVEGIADMDRVEFGPGDWERAKLTASAARAHLATLPLFKEETFTRYLVVREYEEYGLYYDLVDAEVEARCRRGAVVVPLTGTAKVRVKP